eukprot:jgi/Ulvmu1/2253/UM013_0100.1
MTQPAADNKNSDLQAQFAAYHAGPGDEHAGPSDPGSEDVLAVAEAGSSLATAAAKKQTGQQGPSLLQKATEAGIYYNLSLSEDHLQNGHTRASSG